MDKHGKGHGAPRAWISCCRNRSRKFLCGHSGGYSSYCAEYFRGRKRTADYCEDGWDTRRYHEKGGKDSTWKTEVRDSSVCHAAVWRGRECLWWYVPSYRCAQCHSWGWREERTGSYKGASGQIKPWLYSSSKLWWQGDLRHWCFHRILSWGSFSGFNARDSEPCADIPSGKLYL